MIRALAALLLLWPMTVLAQGNIQGNTKGVMGAVPQSLAPAQPAVIAPGNGQIVATPLPPPPGATAEPPASGAQAGPAPSAGQPGATAATGGTAPSPGARGPAAPGSLVPGQAIPGPGGPGVAGTASAGTTPSVTIPSGAATAGASSSGTPPSGAPGSGQAAVAAPDQGSPLPPTWVPRPTAELQVLNKITALTHALAVPVGQSAKLGPLTVTVRACAVRPPGMPSDATAFLDITGAHGKTPEFQGWTLKNEPSLSMFQDPVYDIRVIGCAA
jgi:hypothetical protein